MNTRYKSYLYVFASFLVFVLFVAGYLYLVNLSYQKKLTKCPTVNPNDYDIDDCFGTAIVIEKNVSPVVKPDVRVTYIIIDHIHAYNVGGVKKKSQMKLVDNKLHFIDQAIGGVLTKSEDEPWKYKEDFFSEGKIKKVIYRTLEEIPVYKIVDTNTGEVVVYGSFDEMKPEERIIFEELEKHL